MTYWPISSPSVFAAAKHTHPERTQTSHDGAEPTSDARRHGVEGDGPESSVTDSEELDESDESAVQSGREVKEKIVQPKSTLHRGTEQLPEDDVSSNIIGIKVTRSGHMFATITRSTLTIWQTKARLDEIPSCAHY